MSSSPKVLLMGFSCEESYFLFHTSQDRSQNHAARKLEERYVKGLRKLGLFIDLISLFPASTFPGSKSIFLGFRRTRRPSGETELTIPFVNLPVVKMLSRFLSAFFFSAKWCIGNRGENKIIVLYSLHSPFLLSAVFLKYFFGIPFYVIVTDFPEFMSPRKGLGRILKSLDSWCIQNLARASSGFSYVSEGASLYKVDWQHVPSVVIEGMVDEDIVECSAVGQSSVKTQSDVRQDKILFYSGGLYDEYGVRDLIDAMTYLPANYELWLCGRGPLTEFVREQAKLNARIKYFGLLTPEHVEMAAKNSDILVNPRRLGKKFVSLSFPSKVIEYLSYGIPVLTSRVPSIPSDYQDHLFYIDEVHGKGIAAAILEMSVMDLECIQRRAIAGQKFVCDSKSTVAQCEKFFGLMVSEFKRGVMRRDAEN